MNIIILPYTKIPTGKLELISFLQGAGIIIVAVALPITLIARKHFRRSPSL
jgi:hypothetical protein